MEWISVEKLPEKSCRVWVIHKIYYPYKTIEAVYDNQTKCFIMGPYSHFLPSSIPIVATHYIEIPEFDNDKPIYKTE